MIAPSTTGDEGGERKRMGERKRDVRRGRNSCLRLRRRRVVCVRGRCRGNTQVRRARARFVFVSVIACCSTCYWHGIPILLGCSGYRRRDVHYAHLLYFYTTSYTTLYLHPEDDSPRIRLGVLPPCRHPDVHCGPVGARWEGYVGGGAVSG